MIILYTSTSLIQLFEIHFGNCLTAYYSPVSFSQRYTTAAPPLPNKSTFLKPLGHQVP